jgi:hypothetical protein
MMISEYEDMLIDITEMEMCLKDEEQTNPNRTIKEWIGFSNERNGSTDGN